MCMVHVCAVVAELFNCLQASIPLCLTLALSTAICCLIQGSVGTSAAAADSPLLLQLLKQQLTSGSRVGAGLPRSTTLSHQQQQPSSSVAAPAAVTAATEAQHEPEVLVAAGQPTQGDRSLVVAAVGAGGVVGVKGASKSHMSMCEGSVGEDSGLIGTQMHADEEEEEDYATVLVSLGLVMMAWWGVAVG